MTDYKDESYGGDVGEFIRNRSAEALTRRYREEREKEEEFGEYTRAEFFGINRINELLGRTGCVGVRIYYGIRKEDGQLKPRLVLTAVDENGKDLFVGDLSRGIGPGKAAGAEPDGGKDMPIGREALANGHLCPDRC
ncbi:hypothetical protein [Larkinella soli]|uniref:hypothetical protein n=1 Tax=Larkinella soli TaxID=1770527 RepID=UPI001E44EC48|nr:hypothetical protein [Larkinella soli]